MLPRHLTRKKIVEKSCLIQAKTVSTTTVEKHDRDGGLEQKKFLWESIQEDFFETKIKWKETKDRSTLPRLHCWAGDRLGFQHAVRVCSMSTANPRKQNWMRLKRLDREWATLCRMHPAPATSLPRNRSLPTQPRHGTSALGPALTALDVPLSSLHAHRLGLDCTQPTVDS